MDPGRCCSNFCVRTDTIHPSIASFFCAMMMSERVRQYGYGLSRWMLTDDRCSAAVNVASILSSILLKLLGLDPYRFSFSLSQPPQVVRFLHNPHTPAYTSLLKTLGAGRCWNILSSGLTYFITAFWIINVNISHQLQPSLSLSSWRIDPRFRLTSNTKYPHHSPIASSTVISRFSYEYSSFSVLCTTCEAARCQEAARSLSVPRHNQVVKLVYGYGTQSCGLPTVGPISD
ncbi:uncharacterized protein CCOS01_00521 [Colletotrichum costaricense]|uniref:Uncharacterized protein n=2 Tax=Colletotrichum acutatum species complex TaxID=2707335 RepID=A0AAJ0E657_9PEZI|nr:uncharacterized protein CCOS01_00521 [Colletotrichum costaricense]XP_060377240.1 uncharacterized protein CTAM01_12100 [Colletotrichum tamarilloi]KAK1486667.1 hypothetical protein CTAM01_12100 [Colletotrichum tamarilloi]KAK1539207.1 hypothetical protein CCOS01_00521 [Colletotrichum costaricense]